LRSIACCNADAALLKGGAILLGVAAIWTLWLTLVPLCARRTVAMFLGFLVCLIAACRSALRWCSGLCSSSASTAALPGAIIAQQTVRGIDNFVLLAVPFFGWSAMSWR